MCSSKNKSSEQKKQTNAYTNKITHRMEKGAQPRERKSIELREIE